MAPFERVMVVSYRLSIVTVALSVTIRPQFAIECLRRSNQQGVGHVGPKFPVAPIGRSMMFGSAESERPTLTNGEIIFEDHNHQRHRRTDGQTTCDRKTALRTKVHRAVKLKSIVSRPSVKTVEQCW